MHQVIHQEMHVFSPIVQLSGIIHTPTLSLQWAREATIGDRWQTHESPKTSKLRQAPLQCRRNTFNLNTSEVGFNVLMFLAFIFLWELGLDCGPWVGVVRLVPEGCSPMLCDRTTSNWTLDCQFDHTRFFPPLLWSYNFAPASGVYKLLTPLTLGFFSEAEVSEYKVHWTPQVCDSTFATWMQPEWCWPEHPHITPNSRCTGRQVLQTVFWNLAGLWVQACTRMILGQWGLDVMTSLSVWYQWCWCQLLRPASPFVALSTGRDPGGSLSLVAAFCSWCAGLAFSDSSRNFAARPERKFQGERHPKSVVLVLVGEICWKDLAEIKVHQLDHQ